MLLDAVDVLAVAAFIGEWRPSTIWRGSVPVCIDYRIGCGVRHAALDGFSQVRRR